MENSELITKALNYIKSQNKKSDITIEDVATHAGFSTDYFNRIFFAHTGFNIMEYVRFSRLKKAAHLLRGTDSDILTIALDCGYEAHESFSRAFKNQYGMSPSEYRKKYEKTTATTTIISNGLSTVHTYPKNDRLYFTLISLETSSFTKPRYLQKVFKYSIVLSSIS